MVQAIAVLLLAQGQHVLACRHGSHANLVVTHQQWTYVHRELQSYKPERVIALVHPRLGLSVRVVNSPFHDETGAIPVKRMTWTRFDLADRLAKAKEGTYSARHPGYTYELISNLTPGREGTFRVQAKGNMLFEETSMPQLKPDATRFEKRFRKELNRLSPTTYIRMMCRDGRLWVSEIGSDWPAE